MSEFIIIEEATEIYINGEKYLLEEGDTLIVEEGILDTIMDIAKEKGPELAKKAKDKIVALAKEKGPEYAKKAAEELKKKGAEYADEFVKAKVRSAGAGATARAAAKWLISAVKNDPGTAIEVAKILNQAGYNVPAEFIA